MKAAFLGRLKKTAVSFTPSIAYHTLTRGEKKEKGMGRKGKRQLPIRELLISELCLSFTALILLSVNCASHGSEGSGALTALAGLHGSSQPICISDRVYVYQTTTAAAPTATMFALTLRNRFA